MIHWKCRIWPKVRRKNETNKMHSNFKLLHSTSGRPRYSFFALFTLHYSSWNSLFLHFFFFIYMIFLFMIASTFVKKFVEEERKKNVTQGIRMSSEYAFHSMTCMSKDKERHEISWEFIPCERKQIFNYRRYYRVVEWKVRMKWKRKNTIKLWKYQNPIGKAINELRVNIRF